MPGTQTDEIRTALHDGLTEVLRKDVPELHDDMRLFGDLALDSTGVIELLMELEDSLGLQIDPDELTPETFETVGALIGYIRACLEGAQDAVG
ncbi:acyl carrier protein [Actinacidiphila epipremni]|jgi:acyl carrier protein|uniref:Acyl carrier protein n=1 Tax=Actinacidiphila epipremni TaxID=2053013 RepID=A0ABX0ZP30_9ACTN|nr:acyl carrier protein [Actinacidiphila epipremni]NJP43574.1 acyl carrier protein [Actinacidiphila epipremni]